MVKKEDRPAEFGAEGLLKTFADSYADGEIRALAQEPVQNAKDASYEGQEVSVEYRLLRRMSKSGKPFHILTVTDSGTTGLSGKIKPSRDELEKASEEELQKLRWYHFERLFDSNKGARQGGSRGWGKSIFLHLSQFPGRRRGALMIYDTLLQDSEYRLGDFIILDDEMRIRNPPLLNEQARQTVSAQTYERRGGRISLPLELKPLHEPGTRIVVPHLSKTAIAALRNGLLVKWLQYLWWRPIVEECLSITIVDEERDTLQSIDEPDWWKGEIWSSDATEPGPIHKLYEGCHIQILENIDIGRGCTIKRLALLYDANLHDKEKSDAGPDYAGIQLFRVGQTIETYWKFDLIPLKEKNNFRAFVEFDEITEEKLIDNSQHTRLRRSGIVKNPILPYIQGTFHEFAVNIGLIKSQDNSDGKYNEKFRKTSQFVFEKLLSKAMGEVPIDSNGDNNSSETDKPWDVDILLSYPNANSSRVDWGERISNIRFVVNSHPETLRRNTRYVIEWQAPGEKDTQLLSKFVMIGAEYGLGYRVLTQHEVDDHHIICRKPGIYRIRAAVYEGKRLVAKKTRRIHVEIDPPERVEKPYAVSISFENETSPDELRIVDGDILRLQINGRNRTHEDVFGRLFLRMKEGTIIVSDDKFEMRGKPLGGDDTRHKLHGLRLRVVRGEPLEAVQENGILTLALEPGRRVMQAYLMDGTNELAYGSRILHFESEPAQTQGGLPFEPFAVHSGTPAMWELRPEQNQLRFAANYPLHTELPIKAAPESFNGHNPYELEININGLLQWALEPLLEDETDPSRLDSLREAKPDLVDDDAWDRYMDCLSALEAEMTNYNRGLLISPLEFALTWRKTVAAIYPILISQEND